MSACPRCHAPATEDELRRSGGVCVECVLTIACEDDPPEVANLEVRGTLGRGGMGVVYKAVQTSLGRTVALKVLAPRVAGNAEFADRFTREAKALAQLSHPNVVAVHEFGVQDDAPYLVMEYVEGSSLRRLLSRGRLEMRRALEIAAQVCDALQYAHDRGIVHRDVKPENILIDATGRVKIADFGLAKLADPGSVRLTRSDVVMGTPSYMAPEQIERPSEVDARSDLYSLGVVLYEMLTGELPLGRFKRPSELAPVGPALDEVVLRLLEKKPADRYPSARAVRVRLGGETVRRGPRGRRRWVAAAVGLVLAAGLAAAFFAGANGGAPAASPPAPPVGVWEELAGSASGGGVSRTPGGSVYPSVAAGQGGRLCVAWDEVMEGFPEIYLRMWDGAEWRELGGSGSGGGVSANPGRSQDVEVAVDSAGHPVVVWRDDTDGNFEIYLKRWNGREWVELGGSASGGGISRTPGVSWAPALGLDPAGNPVVAWHEDLPGNREIYLLRWDGQAWVELGGSATGGGVSRTPGHSGWPVMAMDAEGRPALAWHDASSGAAQVYFKRWNGRDWEELGGSASGIGVSGSGGQSGIGDLKMDRRGRPAVTWTDERGGNFEIYLRRWDGGTWADLGGSGSPGGVSRTPTSSGGGMMAFDREDRPLTVWQEDLPGGHEIYLRRWDGEAWVELGGSASGGGVSSTPGASDMSNLTLDSSGRPVVVWAESTPTGHEIYLRRWK